MLGVDQVTINVSGMLESGFDGALRNFVERHAADAGIIADVVRLLFGSLLPLLLFARVFAQFIGQMRSDGFPFAIGVRRKVDVVGL